MGPEHLCSTQLPSDIKSDHLQCVANNALSTIVLQLSSLSNHAEQLFHGLIDDTNALCGRMSELQGKYESIHQKTQQLDVKTDGSSKCGHSQVTISMLKFVLCF